MKNERGITLIALIITIIILIILAAVSIRAAYNSGIIDYSINGTQKYVEGEKRERSVLLGAEEFLKSITGKIDNIDTYVEEGEDNENDLAEGELALQYKIEYHGNDYANILITPKLGGIDTYEDYARRILNTTTKTKEQIYMEGILYQAEEENWSMASDLRAAKSANNFQQFIYVYTYQEATSISNMDEYVTWINDNWSYYFLDADDLLIAWECVEKENFEEPYVQYAKNILNTTTKTKEQIYMEGILYQAESYEWTIAEDLREAYEENDLNEFISLWADEEVSGITTIDAFVEYVNNKEWYGDPYTSADDLLIDWQIVEQGGFFLTLECEGIDINYGTSIGRTEEFYIDFNGTYTFTGTMQNGKTASIEVEIANIINILVSDISLSSNQLNIELGQMQALTATVSPDDARNKYITWSSSDPTVATVSTSGVVTAKKIGTATITASATDRSGVTAECAVTVWGTPVQSITLNNSSLTMEVSTFQTLTATINPNNVSLSTLQWTSSNPTVASIGSNGLVEANNVGTATITAAAIDGSNVSATCTVTVLNTYHIGERANYDCLSGSFTGGLAMTLDYQYSVDSNPNWIIFGIDSTTGRILLISESPVDPRGGYGVGQSYGGDSVDQICSIYQRGNFASSARSVNTNDIYSVTNNSDTIGTNSVKRRILNSGTYWVPPIVSVRFGE